MKILVVGASQGTGALAVARALEKGHDVTALSRSGRTEPASHARLTSAKGSFHDADAVRQAVKGHDAVIVTASATSLKAFKENPRYFSQGTEYVIAAMKAEGVKRLSVLSALGSAESRALAGWLLRTLVIDGILKVPFLDHGRQEELVKASGLEWIVARPGRLTSGPARRQYKKVAEIAPVPMSISRADVADFLVEACEVDAWVGKAVQIGG